MLAGNLELYSSYLKDSIGLAFSKVDQTIDFTLNLFESQFLSKYMTIQDLDGSMMFAPNLDFLSIDSEGFEIPFQAQFTHLVV
jgi:hypothetical protein